MHPLPDGNTDSHTNNPNIQVNNSIEPDTPEMVNPPVLPDALPHTPELLPSHANGHVDGNNSMKNSSSNSNSRGSNDSYPSFCSVQSEDPLVLLNTVKRVMTKEEEEEVRESGWNRENIPGLFLGEHTNPAEKHSYSFTDSQVNMNNVHSVSVKDKDRGMSSSFSSGSDSIPVPAMVPEQSALRPQLPPRPRALSISTSNSSSDLDYRPYRSVSGSHTPMYWELEMVSNDYNESEDVGKDRVVYAADRIISNTSTNSNNMIHVDPSSDLSSNAFVTHSSNSNSHL